MTEQATDGREEEEEEEMIVFSFFVIWSEISGEEQKMEEERDLEQVKL